MDIRKHPYLDNYFDSLYDGWHIIVNILLTIWGLLSVGTLFMMMGILLPIVLIGKVFGGRHESQVVQR